MGEQNSRLLTNWEEFYTLVFTRTVLEKRSLIPLPSSSKVIAVMRGMRSAQRMRA
jgi:hypothetical protein